MELFNGAQKSKERGGEPVWTLIYQTLSGQSWLLWLLTSTRNLFLFLFFFLPSQKPANLGVVSCVFIREEHEVQLFAVFIYAVRGSFILCTR